MPRKDNSDNPVRIRVYAVSLPKRVTPKLYLQRLINVIDGRATMPPTWDVRLEWQNPRSSGITRFVREDDFESAVTESREGFNSIVRAQLVHMLRRYK